MFKRILLTTALAALLGVQAAPAIAQWAFDDPYWKRNETTQFAPPFAAGSDYVTGVEEQKARLDGDGFPQYSN